MTDEDPPVDERDQRPRGGPPESAWSRPDTPVDAPPLTGATPGASPAQPHGVPPAAGPPPAEPTRPTDPTPPGPTPPAGPIPPAVTLHPARDRRVWWILGVVAALLFCCCPVMALGTLAWTTGLLDRLTDQRRSVGLNEPARDGSLEFQVSTVQCGITEVGTPFDSRRAAGQYCVAELTVRNLGGRPAALSDRWQSAYGPSHERWSVDSDAGELANSGLQAFRTPVGPGETADGVLVYDIPTGSRVVRLRLRHAPDAHGVTVRVP